MARTKTIKKGNDGKRKETRAEKHARIESQKQAREACQQILPYAFGVVVLCLLIFGIYVRSVPPKQPKPQIFNGPPNTQQGVPEFMNVQVDPSLKGEEQQAAAMEQAKRLIEEREATDAAAGGERVEATVTPGSSKEDDVLEL